MFSTYKQRISKIQKLLGKNNNDALFLSSAPHQVRSGDTHYKYRQDSNLIYLTGILAPHSIHGILIDSQKITFFVPQKDPVKERWEGKDVSAKPLIKSLNGDLIQTNSPEKEILPRLKNIHTLYASQTPGSISWDLIQRILKIPTSARSNIVPKALATSDTLLAPMRMIKDKFELSIMQDAADLTCAIFNEIKSCLDMFESELDIKSHIDFLIAQGGANPAFDTIVAAGKSAATLHYRNSINLLKSKDLVLLDFGAELNGYASDLSRVVPARGRLDDWQKDLYEVVLNANLAAIESAKPGVEMKKIYGAATKELSKGLASMKVVRGTPKAIQEKGLFKDYFMHGIGHGLGIDVHDIGERSFCLQEGMVITIEPGLYFNKPVGRIKSPCGIRIEDDIFISRGKSGPIVLTIDAPKSIDTIIS